MTSTVVLLVTWLLIFSSVIFRSTALLDVLSGVSPADQAVLLAILVVIIYIPGVMFSINFWRDTREDIIRCLLAGLFMPLYNLLQIPAVVLAAYRHMKGQNGWVKTERSDDIRDEGEMKRL
jgi:hypothetical protein